MKKLNKATFFNILKNSIIALPYAILISFIFTIGGVTQEIFIKFFASEESNLYDTVHQGVITFIDFGLVEWFTAYYYTWSIVPCLLIVLSVNNTTPKKAFIRTVLLIFIALTILDYFLSCCSLGYFDMLVNTISNLIGSPIISAILLLSINTGTVINNYFENKNVVLRRIISSLIAIIFSFIIVFVVYFIYKNIYTVTSSNINLTMNLPVHGEYNTDNNANDKFGLFSSPTSNTEKLSWMGFSRDFTLKWSKENKEIDTYSAEIRVLEGCLPNKNLISKALLNTPTYTVNDISNIELSINDGPIHLYTLNNSNIEKLLVTPKDTEIFGIKDSKKTGFQLSRVLLESDKITHLSWAKQASYALALPSMNPLDSGVEIKDRDITIKYKNQIFKIKLIPNTIPSDFNISCLTFPASDKGDYKLKSIFGGIILTLKRTNEQTSIFNDFNKKNETFMRGILGWMTAEEVNKTEISSFINRGNLNMLNLSAHINQLIIDSKEYRKSKTLNDIYITGAKLEGGIVNGDLIRINGSARAIYIDHKRASLSRWEKIDFKYKLLFFGFFPGLLFFIIKRSKIILDDQEKIQL